MTRSFRLLALGLIAGAFLTTMAPERLLAQGKDDPDQPENELLIPEKQGKLILNFDPGWHTGMVRKVFFMPDGKEVITLSTDHTIRIWDPLTGAMHKVLHPPGYGGLFVADLSADGKRLAVASRHAEVDKLSYIIYVLALPEGRIERVLKGHTAEIRDLAISADGKHLASSGGTRGSTKIWDLDKDEPGRLLRKAGFGGLAFSPDGASIACVGAKGEIIDLASGKEVAKLKGNRVAWSPDGKTLAVSGRGKDDDKLIHVLDAQGKEIRVIPRNGSLESMAFSADSRSLLVVVRPVAQAAGAYLFDVTTGAETTKFLAKTKDGVGAAVAGTLSPDGRLAVTGGHGVAIWKTQDGTLHKHLPTPKWISFQNQEAAWSLDGKAVAWSKLPKVPSFHLGELQTRPALTDAQAALLKQEQGPWALEPIMAGSGFNQFRVLKDGKETCVVKFPAGRSLTLLGKDQVVAASSFGQLVLFEAHTGKELRRFDGHRSPINSIAPSPDGRFILSISSGDDQRLRIWNPEREKPLLTMYRLGQDWIVWTPEGYYAATPGGERLMGWIVDNGLEQMPSYYPAERFRKQLYRPDVIKLLLEKSNLKNALETANAALKKQGTIVAEGVADLDKLLPPRAAVHILDKTKLPAVTLKASAQAAVKEQPVVALQLLVDGRPAGGAEALKTFGPGQATAEATFTLTLPPGKHQVRVLAKSADSSSVSDAVDVDAGAALVKAGPNMHVLAVGINQYKNHNGDLDLLCAANDANAIAATFKQRCGKPLFDQVLTTVLLDKQAQAGAILDQLHRLQKTAGPTDVVVVFFAGHGVKNPKGGLYLLTQEADLGDLEKTSLSGDVLKKELAEMPCRVLLMLDACHSNAVGPARKAVAKNLTGAVSDLTQLLTEDDCGVAVMCAAMSYEKSIEDPQLNHGLFTLAVQEGLSGKAEPNRRDKKLYVDHLHTYVRDEVQFRSNNRQHPFLNLPWTLQAFPLAAP